MRSRALLALALLLSAALPLRAQDSDSCSCATARLGVVGLGPHEVPFFCVPAPSPEAEDVPPSLYVDLPGGGHLVIVTPTHQTELVRIPVDRPVATTFGGFRAVHVSIFDHDERKVFESRVTRPAGRLYISIRPDWDEDKCRRSLSIQAAIVRAVTGDRPALEWVKRLRGRCDDRVAEHMLGEYAVCLGLRAPPPPPATPAPAPTQPVPATPQPATPAPAEQLCPESELASLISSLRGGFDDAKITTLRSFAERRWFSIAQTKRIVGCFAFSDGKLGAIDVLNNRIVDRENFFELYSLFPFGDDKEKLRKIEKRSMR